MARPCRVRFCVLSVQSLERIACIGDACGFGVSVLIGVFSMMAMYGGMQSLQSLNHSVDGGHTFTRYDAKLDTVARYGAFPTDSVWCVLSAPVIRV